MPVIRVGDIDMYYELHGAGPPLVVIGGLALDISEYEWMVQWLATSHSVLAFDNRGAGRTDKPDVPYSIPMMASDTDGLLGALGIEHATVLGISMGGKIALNLTLDHPGRVARLVLVSTQAGARTPETGGRLAFLAQLSGRVFPGKYPQPRYAFARQREASAVYHCGERLHEIQIPTTILHGRHDHVVRLRYAEQMRAGIAGSSLVTFHGGHLFFMMRERKWFKDTVDDVLANSHLGPRTLSTTWVALLRAVNVGRHNRMKMSDLRALLEALGYADVRTHLQSGNAIFSTQHLDAAEVEQEMAAGVRRDIGMEVKVLVRAAAELRAIIAANPFTDIGTVPNDMHITFLSGTPPADAMAAGALERFAPHRFALGERVVYMRLYDPVPGGRLPDWERMFRLHATTRNWNTTTALRDLAG